MKYGELPLSLGIVDTTCEEMMFYQYLPVKLRGKYEVVREPRLAPFDGLIGKCSCDYIGVFGLNSFVDAFAYLTVKHLYQPAGVSFNRMGYHSDGFMTDDINYIWSNRDPTVFNTSQYALTMHHEYSLSEMDQQSMTEKEVHFQNKELLRLNQFNIHKVADVTTAGMRTFFKMSFSKDKYNLIGNAHNHNLNYKWEMQPRAETRNHPIK
jgi:hypothetical protein